MIQPEDTLRDSGSRENAKRQEAVSVQTSPFPLPTQARVWVAGHNSAAKKEVERHLTDVVRPPAGPIDVALIAAVSEEEARYFAEKIRRRVRPGGTIWLIRERRDAPHSPPQVDTPDRCFLGNFEVVLLSES